MKAYVSNHIYKKKSVCSLFTQEKSFLFSIDRHLMGEPPEGNWWQLPHLKKILVRYPKLKTWFSFLIIRYYNLLSHLNISRWSAYETCVILKNSKWTSFSLSIENDRQGLFRYLKYWIFNKNRDKVELLSSSCFFYGTSVFNVTLLTNQTCSKILFFYHKRNIRNTFDIYINI